jgi:hypothetical protein
MSLTLRPAPLHQKSPGENEQKVNTFWSGDRALAPLEYR